MTNNTYAFNISDCGIVFETSILPKMEEQFLVFLANTPCQDSIRFYPVEKFSFDIAIEVEEDLVTEQDTMYSEYFIEQKYIRTFHGTGTKEPYAILSNIGPGQWECEYLKSYERYFTSIGNCFGHIALERILMEQEAAILHASFIEYEGQGILFTGPSGIGKSTQAELWKQLEGAEILNGDRTILRKKDNIWYAYGSPYAGSSRIYKNKSVPIKAIVTLEKSPEEDICMRLKPGAAFGVLYSGMTLNTWNRHFMEKAMNMVQSLCVEIPVFQLRCRPQQSAVDCLKKELSRLQEVKL